MMQFRSMSTASLGSTGTQGSGASAYSDLSELTVTRTITRLEDLPKDRPPEVGTVLEEETPKPVQLMVEFLGTNNATNTSTREFIDELYKHDMELSVECQFLPKVDIFSNSDPFVVVYMRDTNRHEWKEIGKTEQLVNCHFPKFTSKFVLQAAPDRDMDKEILLKVYGKGSFGKRVIMGHGMCTIWDVVISPGQCKVIKMESVNPNKDTWLIISGDIVRKEGQERKVTVNVKFDKSAKPKGKTFFMLNRSLKKGRWTPIYRSEGHTSANREFQPAVVDYANLFCASDSKPMRLEFYQKRPTIDPKLVGFVQVSMDKIEKMEEGKILHWWSGQDGTAPGLVLLAKKDITEEEITLWFLITND
eukprot:Plantae.Rhodophyta-Hildenbrandia_rubra.ctg18477.p1 GENE.Plantae.Rhodophyta-Hildenbrandia_rubra.ctg18477~~Plantae.Rhodophyta-Hildenbrandia_rubra.ctg18477.p1  ORF type:complete len:361 (+),score=70.90 Plantae.Rhodophyta-Hildenbrandia_rubra.ctg18477:372-1454(+)